MTSKTLLINSFSIFVPFGNFILLCSLIIGILFHSNQLFLSANLKLYTNKIFHPCKPKDHQIADYFHL